MATEVWHVPGAGPDTAEGGEPSGSPALRTVRNSVEVDNEELTRDQ